MLFSQASQSILPPMDILDLEGYGLKEPSSVQASVALIQRDGGISCSESGEVSLLIRIEPGIRDWLSKLQDEGRLNSTLRVLMRERIGENTVISQTRCGLCRRFKESNCPVNDLYLHPDTLVYSYFADKCAVYEKAT